MRRKAPSRGKMPLPRHMGGTPMPRRTLPPVDDSLPPILPPGTQIVTLGGAAASILRAPVDADHAYRVRFPDGSETSLRRAEFRVLSHHQRPGGTVGEHDLWDHVIYRCIVGSRAYGLDSDHSDTDRRGIYLPPADRHWSLFGVPEQLENDATQEVYWELQKFLILALKANPNVLECLWTPLVEHATPLAEELRAMRKSFLSKLAYQTYNGYVMSQFKKLQQDLRSRGGVKWKHVMHLLRLLLSGIGTLRDGEVPVDAREHRDALLAVRRGEKSFDECDAWRLALHREFDHAFERTALPDRPDYDAANAFLLRARRGAMT